MATSPLPGTISRESAATSERAFPVGALALTAALPFLFLHVEYEPSFSVGLGTTTATASLSDVCVWIVALVALWTLVRRGAGRLRAGLPIWIAGAALFAWIFVEVAVGHSRTPGYAATTHAVTALKLLEYGALALAFPLLVRGARDLSIFLSGLAIWSAVATAVGIAEFFGAAIFLADGTVGGRQASFLSSLDFTALSTAAFLAGGVGLLQPRLGLHRRIAWLALVSGVLGTIVGASLSGVIGLITGAAAVAVLLLVRRELPLRATAAVLACAAVAVIGAVAIRSTDLSSFASFLGKNGKTQHAPKKVQTYAHRTLLVWLGFEIWKEHPLVGSGFEASTEPGAFVPHLAAAHKRFPDEAPLAFPSPAPSRRYGVQNLYVQALADLGVVGLALLVAFFVAGLWLAARAAIAGDPSGTLAAGWLALLVWLWTAQGFVAGLPLDALLFLGFGLAALAAARRRHAHA